MFANLLIVVEIFFTLDNVLAGFRKSVDFGEPFAGSCSTISIEIRVKENKSDRDNRE